MKYTSIILFLFTILLLLPSASNTQVPITLESDQNDNVTARRINLGANSEIAGKFITPDVYDIDTRTIVKMLESEDFDSQLKIQFGAEYDWNLELYSVDLRSPDYKLTVVTENGIKEYRDNDVKTYYGYLQDRPETEVRMTIRDGFLYGFVKEEGNTVYFEPAERFQPSLNRGEVVLYQPNQVTEAVVTCAHSEKVDKSTGNSNSPSTLSSSGNCYELDLAIATDYSYYQDRGSNVNAVTAYTLGVMNNVATNYELNGNNNFDNGVEFSIVENFVVTTPNGDPWPASTSPNTLLESFRAWGNNGGFSATFDLGQLWSNRDFNGGTVGLAYLDVICSSARYHVLQDFTSSAAQLRVLTAHEIGHNFGAEHDAAGSGFIMAPSVNNTSTWSQSSKNTANQAINVASSGTNPCFTSCATAPPTTPPVSDFTANTNSTCSNSPITFFDNSTNSPDSWNWSFPGGSPSSSTEQNPTVIYPDGGNYSVSLTTANEAGTGNTEVKNNYIEIVQSNSQSCIPGGNTGNGGVRLFELGSINNSSGTAAGDGNTYLDNLCTQETELDPGETYIGRISVGNTNTNTLEAVRIYIDYNDDGDFLDEGEFIASSGSQVYAGTVNFEYAVPENPILNGITLRMRIMANQSLNGPCQNMTTGQVEDYGIVFSGAASLPVTLNEYTAFPKDQFSLLNWDTESEHDNDYFTIEHATNGRDFTVLEEISGQGTTAQKTAYEYLHKTPIIGDNYYRLTQTDFDGTQEILGTRVVTFKTDKVVVEIQPNPIYNETLRTAYISPEDGMVEMTVLGVDGKMVRYLKQEVITGTTMINLDLPDLSNGIYFLRTVQGTVVKTTRFVKSN